MISLDLRTVMLSYTLSNFICMAVIAVLWNQNHRQFSGIGFWLADFLLQWGAVLLVTMRGSVQ
jgi:hypothetical protein